MAPAQGKDTRRIVTYDFKRPDKFSLEQIRTIAIVHEDFARRASVALSARLGEPTEIKLGCVDQKTLEDMCAQMGAPSCSGIISMAPLKTHALFHMDAQAEGAILSRLSGAEPKARDAGEAAREPSALDRELLGWAYGLILSELNQAWAALLPLNARLLKIESVPNFIQIVPPNDLGVVINFSLNVGGVSGSAFFFVPFLTIEPILPRLRAQYWFDHFHASPRDTVSARLLRGHARGLGLRLTISAQAPRQRLRDLLSLKEGSLIPLAAFDQGELSLEEGGLSLEDKFGAGSPCLARLRPKGKRSPRKGGAYSLVGPIDEIARELAGEGPKEAPPGELIEAAMSGLNKRIDSALSELTKKVEELGARQESLSGPLEPESPEEEPRASAFSWFKDVEPGNLRAVLQGERPELIALILVFADKATGARVLSLLPVGQAADTLTAMPSQRPVSPEIVRILDRALNERLASSLESWVEGNEASVNAARELLTFLPKDAEGALLHELERRGVPLAENSSR
jgi:flagellar motor switch protein FliM